MDEGRFQDLVDRLGENTSRWPDDDRLAADALLMRSAKARAIQEEAAMLRAAFESLPRPSARPGLAARITALIEDDAVPPAAVSRRKTRQTTQP